jgi:hypothetical protein
MGISISEEKHQKLEANRRAGRLCASGNSRAGCSVRATKKVVQDSWIYRIGEGEVSRHEMPMCTRHARQFPVGFEGVNFRVLSIKEF